MSKPSPSVSAFMVCVLAALCLAGNARSETLFSRFSDESSEGTVIIKQAPGASRCPAAQATDQPSHIPDLSLKDPKGRSFGLHKVDKSVWLLRSVDEVLVATPLPFLALPAYQRILDSICAEAPDSHDAVPSAEAGWFARPGATDGAAGGSWSVIQLPAPIAESLITISTTQEKWATRQRLAFDTTLPANGIGGVETQVVEFTRPGASGIACRFVTKTEVMNGSGIVTTREQSAAKGLSATVRTNSIGQVTGFQFLRSDGSFYRSVQRDGTGPFISEVDLLLTVSRDGPAPPFGRRPLPRVDHLVSSKVYVTTVNESRSVVFFLARTFTIITAA